MPYIVINATNAFDPLNQTEFETEALADSAARELLRVQPGSSVRLAQVLKRYSAEVTVIAEDAQAVEGDSHAHD